MHIQTHWEFKLALASKSMKTFFSVFNVWKRGRHFHGCLGHPICATNKYYKL